MRMKLRVFYLFWVCVAGQSVSGQPSLPPIPNNDYDVYSVVVNAFSACIDMRRAYQRGQLVFVTTTTAVQDKNGFRFNASELQATINKTNGPQTTNQFQKEPGWVYFLNSVNTTQFTQYELKQLPQFACRQSAWWTDELQERYFGIEKVAGKSRMKGSGYGGLRTDYKTFGGIMSFSKVAYSLDGTKAFCYHSETSDGEAGAGYVVFLEKKGTVWRVVGSAMLWIS